MKIRNTILSIFLARPFLGLLVQAQAFVSARNGVDVGTCPLSPPCRSSIYSLTQAAEGDMVNVIAPAVTIHSW